MRLALGLCVALSLAAPACRGCGDASSPAIESGAGTAGGGSAPDNGALPRARVTCPVCGLEFDAGEAVATRVHGGVTYYFLLEDHARAFAARPTAYLEASARP
jgi:YHS domain-containing protein